MTEEQLRAFPAFKKLPIFDEREERADTVTRGPGNFRQVRECSTVRQVTDCLKDSRLAPLGALRVTIDGGHVVVAYFADLS
jgi:hypothetical protein